MQKSLIRHPLTQVVFKSLGVFSALALMPVVWAYLSRGSLLPLNIVDSWLRMTKDFFEGFLPFALVFFPCALASVVWWWRKPRWYTALTVYFMLAVVCGAPGITTLGSLFLFAGR